MRPCQVVASDGRQLGGARQSEEGHDQWQLSERKMDKEVQGSRAGARQLLLLLLSD